VTVLAVHFMLQLFKASIKNQKNNLVANYEDQNLLPKQHVRQFNQLKACEVQHLLKEKGMLFCFAVCTVWNTLIP